MEDHLKLLKPSPNDKRLHLKRIKEYVALLALMITISAQKFICSPRQTSPAP